MQLSQGHTLFTCQDPAQMGLRVCLQNFFFFFKASGTVLGQEISCDQELWPLPWWTAGNSKQGTKSNLMPSRQGGRLLQE